jgi:Ni/Co efflux regulator RcnB
LKDQPGRINVLFINQASYLPIYLYYSLLKITIMKKIFTLLFAVGFLAAAHAQSGSRDNRDNKQYDQRVDQKNGQWDNDNGYSNGKDIARNDSRFDNNRFGRGVEFQIAQINRKYDFQIQRVQHDFFMKRYEKMRMIRSLEAQRQQGNQNGVCKIWQ